MAALGEAEITEVDDAVVEVGDAVLELDEEVVVVGGTILRVKVCVSDARFASFLVFEALEDALIVMLILDGWTSEGTLPDKTKDWGSQLIQDVAGVIETETSTAEGSMNEELRL